MPDPLLLSDADALRPLLDRPGVPALDPAVFAAHRADAHLAVLDADAALRARCSLWWTQTPALPNERVGLVGHYAADDDAAAGALLDRACRTLAEYDATLAIGPMDGSTWRSYRLVTSTSAEPPFFLEPDTPPDWPGHWTAAGFTPLAHYGSTLDADLPDALPSESMNPAVHLRTLDPHALEAELRLLYDLSTDSFRRNFLYMPLSEDDFFDLYRPLIPYVRPELVLFAEIEGEAAGFAFGVPDVLQARRGQPIDTVIFKTLGVRIARQGIGLGGLLYRELHRRAGALGYRRVISALMHEDNRSFRLGERAGRVIRRYTLYGRLLENRDTRP